MSRDDAHPGVVPMAFSRPAGFVDRHPRAARRAAHLRRRLRALFERYGYEPVEVPTLEYIDLYHRQRIGDGLFHGLLSARLPDGAEFPARDLAASPDPHGLPPLAEAVHEVVLRPEFTAPVARLVITELAERVEPPALPWRLHYAGSVFRDLGVGPLRQREFTQVGVERIGGPRRPGDLEILQLACDGAEALGLPDWHLTLGHAGYLAAVLAELEIPLGARAAVAVGLDRAVRLRRKARGPQAVWAAYLPARLPELRRRATAAERARWSFLSDPAVAPQDPALRDALPAAHAAWLRRSWGGHHGVAPAAIDRLLSLADHFGAPDDTLPALRAFCATDPARAALDDLSATLADLETLRGAPVDVGPAASRGIAYYTGLSFELHTGGTANAYTDVCGGGRYDGLHTWMDARARLTREVRGLPVPPRPDWLDGALRGVGLSFGIERLLSVPGLGAPPQPRVVWVGYAAEDQRLPALRAVAALRAGGAEVLFADGLEAAPSPRATVRLVQRAGHLRPLDAPDAAPVAVPDLLETLRRAPDAQGEEPA